MRFETFPVLRNIFFMLKLKFLLLHSIFSPSFIMQFAENFFFYTEVFLMSKLEKNGAAFGSVIISCAKKEFLKAHLHIFFQFLNVASLINLNCTGFVSNNHSFCINHATNIQYLIARNYSPLFWLFYRYLSIC